MEEARETLPTRVRYGKWAGLCGAVIALIAHQQIASAWVYTSCPRSPPLLVFIFFNRQIVAGMTSGAVKG